MENARWISRNPEADTHAAFRVTFETRGAAVEIHTVGSSWYQAWLDGDWVLEGPLRFSPTRVEHDTHKVDLPPGKHVLAFHVHHTGVATRILPNIEPFLWCRILCGGKELPLSWRAAPLGGYRPRVRRINPQLGWMEYCDTAKNPQDWQEPDFDNSAWRRPVRISNSLPDPAPAGRSNVLRLPVSVQLLESGNLAPTFGYLDDDPPVGFFLRDRKPGALPVKGSWHLYDLGRVRLGIPDIVIDGPAGTVVEIARSERLQDGRVSPWINLSLGQSCNLDRYILAGGRQTIAPHTPKGGRFMEIHIVNSTTAKIHDVSFYERTSHPPTEAQFKCNDPLLNRIWATGIETYRACAEDVLTDNPTRERGQWMNDVSTVHMAIASVAWHDLSLNRRAFRQAADCCRKDGLVAGMCPGGPEYLPTLSLQWVAAVVDYYKLTGDLELLESLHGAAQRNLKVFENNRKEEGWNFIDWGYEEEEPEKLAPTLYYLLALRRMVEWSLIIRRDASLYVKLSKRAETMARTLVKQRTGRGFEKLGYHCTVFALMLDLLPENRKAPARAWIKRHILSCFPNDASAPRNDEPFRSERRLITPYFAHYAFPLLIESGDMDFVLDQYRHCWGWMLEANPGTWLEVFDTRWSGCHAWSGSPTWQLSRYLSGLHPRRDLGADTYEWNFQPGSLKEALIRLPHDGDWIEVRWKRSRSGIKYTLRAPSPATIRGLEDADVRISGERTFSLA